MKHGGSIRPAWWALAGVVAAALSAAVIARGPWASPGAVRDEVERAVAARRWAEAEALLLARLAKDSNDDDAWLWLGDVRAALGRDQGAVDAWRRVAGSPRSRADAATRVGDLMLKRGDLARSERAFREAARAEPSAVAPRRKLVYLLVSTQRDDEAADALWELYRLAPERHTLVTLAWLGLSRPETGDPEAALAPFLTRTPDDPILRRARGLVRLREGRTAEAEADLDFAARWIANDVRGRLALAECRLALGRLDGLDDLLDPEPPPTRPADRAARWKLKAQLAEARGQADDALACLRRAVEANEGNSKAHYRLGQWLVRRGDPAAKSHLDRAEAIRMAERRLLRALEGQTGVGVGVGASPQSLQDVARLCDEVGRSAEASAWYEQAALADPSRRPNNGAGFARHAGPVGPSAEPLRVRDRPTPEPGPTVADGPKPARGGDGGPRFEDVAARAGVTYRYDCGENGDMFLGDTMGGGVGLIDYDGDGRLDIYLVNGCKLPFDVKNPPRPNRLYRNTGDGPRFEDVTARAGVAGYGYGMGCAVGDYDSDGRDDLFVTGLGRTVLYRNRGDGTFEDVTTRAGVGSARWTTAAGFADLDADGDLDLVVVTYVDADMNRVPVCKDTTGKPMHCSPGQFPAQPDHLFRNNGDGTFTDVGPVAGFDAPNGFGLGLAVADLDEDGRLDVFVANDAAPNFFFRNLGGLRFEELGVTSGLAYDGTGRATASMGVVAEDFDSDGRIDVFHTNFLNEPNTLHRNLGGGLFADDTARFGLDGPSRPVTGFGASALDADNDGDLDLFVANGHVDDRPWVGRPMAQPPHFYERRGGVFELTGGAASPYFARPVVGRGVAAGDLDNDGRVDLVVVHRDAPVSILHNVSRGGRWVGLSLRSGPGSTPPVGARVSCRVGGRTTVRWVTSGTSYLAQCDTRLWFGLGEAGSVDRLEVAWPSGRADSWEGLAADRIYEIREGGGPSPLRVR